MSQAEGAGAASRGHGPLGPPSLEADVASFALPDVFGWLEATGKSGLLAFARREHAKDVYLHRGEVVFASSNQMTDRLGECLLRAGVLRLEQLREAERCFSPGARFGKVLVERGFLTPRELWNGVKYQVEEIVRSLFAYGAGRVAFFEGDVQPDNVVRLALPTRRLVSEGVQRANELARFLSVLEGPRVGLAVVSDAQIPLASAERALVQAIARQPSFPELCVELGVEREAAARSLQLLRLVGAVKLVRSETPEAALAEREVGLADAEVVRARVGRYAKLIESLAAPIVAVEGAGLLRERLERTLEEAAGRYPALLAGVTLGETVGLPVDAVVERALRLGEASEEQVGLALSELVSYLEFELKNHPDLDDPDAWLEGLAPLRAGLET